MAQKVQVLLVDDLDGGEAHTTVPFALDGTTYEIDLSESNVKRLHKSLAPFVEKARKVRGTRGTRTNRMGPEPKVIRAWAAENGVEVNATGRIPGDVVRQFEAANG